MFNQWSFETVSIKMNQKEFVILITVAILSPVLILLGVIFCSYKNKEKITEGEVNQDEPKTTKIFEKFGTKWSQKKTCQDLSNHQD